MGRVDPYPTRPMTGQKILTHTQPIYLRSFQVKSGSDRVGSSFDIPNCNEINMSTHLSDDNKARDPSGLSGSARPFRPGGQTGRAGPSQNMG
jgi:hypothetical protein